MTRRRLPAALLTAFAATTVLLLLAAPAGAASTAEINRAEATSDWSHGSFAGSVSWDECNAGCLSWEVLVFDEPTNEYACDPFDYAENSDPNINKVWASGEQHANGTVPIEATNASLIAGVVGQRLCVLGLGRDETGYHPRVLTQKDFIALPGLPDLPGPSTKCIAARASVKKLKLRRAAAKKAGNAKRVRKLNRALKKAVAKRASAC